MKVTKEFHKNNLLRVIFNYSVKINLFYKSVRTVNLLEVDLQVQNGQGVLVLYILVMELIC